MAQDTILLERSELKIDSAERELKFTMLQLAVATIIRENPALSEYLVLQGESSLRDLLHGPAVVSADAHKLQVRMASITGEIGAYKHLLTLEAMHEDLVLKCKQLSTTNQ